jgi:hypothetical protein
MLNYDVIVVGCARNVEKSLNISLDKLNIIRELFKSTKIIIFENDSTDNTLNILKNWEEKKIIKLITEKKVPGLRTERLAYARNKLYNEAMKHNFDLLIVIDLDVVIRDLTKEAILSCFDIKDDWAMLGGNQTNTYYDLWALRTYDDWMPFDCWECVNIHKKSNDYCVKSRFKQIKQDSDPIKVKSCFSGFAIYKRKYLDNCSYGNGLQGPDDNKYEICEHVTFNQGILKNGGSIFINPKLITQNNDNGIEHFNFSVNNNIYILFFVLLLIIIVILYFFACKFNTKSFTNTI